MAVYSARHRGALEYDKFMIALIDNAVLCAEAAKEVFENEETMGKLREVEHKVNTIYEFYSKGNNITHKLLIEKIRSGCLNGDT